jgi:hypothetical protein
MSWVITPQQRIPAVIGEAFGGGYFAGYISHTADGNPTHALIVAPVATGASGTGYTVTTQYEWKTTLTSTTGTTSAFDGKANTDAMIAAGIADHPAANFCVGLSIGGFSDWYLPAHLELDIAYFNLKPSTTSNNTSSGINSYAVPPRSVAYTASYPAQSYLSAFATGGAQAFQATIHNASQEVSAARANQLNMGTGQINSATNNKTTSYSVRAFRRIAL